MSMYASYTVRYIKVKISHISILSKHPNPDLLPISLASLPYLATLDPQPYLTIIYRFCPRPSISISILILLYQLRAELDTSNFISSVTEAHHPKNKVLRTSLFHAPFE